MKQDEWKILLELLELQFKSKADNLGFFSLALDTCCNVCNTANVLIFVHGITKELDYGGTGSNALNDRDCNREFMEFMLNHVGDEMEENRNVD